MQNREQGQAPQPAEGAITVTRENFASNFIFVNMLMFWSAEQIREFHGMLSRRPECQPTPVDAGPGSLDLETHAVWLDQMAIDLNCGLLSDRAEGIREALRASTPTVPRPMKLREVQS